MTLRRLGHGALIAVSTLVLTCAPALATGGPAGAAPRLVPVAASAPEPDQRWSILPIENKKLGPRVRYEFRTDAGKTITDTVVINNLTKAPLVFNVYSADAYTSAEGAFTIPPGAVTPAQVGTWLSLRPRKYTIAGGGNMKLPFTLKVPKNATPGDHAGGIVASVTETEKAPDGQLVNVDRRVGVRMYLRVNGKIEPGLTVKVDATDYNGPAFLVGGGALDVTYRIHNTGNSRLLQGSGRMTVSGPLGLGLGEQKAGELPEILPGSEVVRRVKVSGVWPAGAISATARLNPVTAEGQLPTLTNTRSFWATPWFLVVLIIAVGLVFGVRYGLRRWRRRTALEPAFPAPTAG